MEIVERRIEVRDYLTKSNLPASDYVINPYVGCPHACKYCYARFMKRFTGHKEKWGSFIDIKECSKPISRKKLEGKSVFIASVTDCYNEFEKKYEIMRKILEQLKSADCEVTISTKSNLVLRDMDLLKEFSNLKVALSVNTLDEKFRNDMDSGSTIAERLEAMKLLHDVGIYTVLFMSPIFPFITDWKKIIKETKDFTDEYWFENLNLRGEYKQEILDYIDSHYPQFTDEYQKIYVQKDSAYWENLSHILKEYCKAQNVNNKIYFFHKKLVQQKLEKR